MSYPTISFIGAGKMATNLIAGLIANGYPSHKIWASKPNIDSLKSFAEKFKIHLVSDNHLAAKAAEVIIFCVKPQKLQAVAVELNQIIQEQNCLVLSIATGIKTSTLSSWLGEKKPIIRCMPNIASLVHSGITGLFANAKASEEQKALAESIMRSVGMVVWLTQEEQMDIITAISGSGPAYFLYIMEAMEEVAIELGLPSEMAHLLTIETTLGTARLAIESNQPFISLRQQVTSPQGTTAAALKVLEENEVSQKIKLAIKAAFKRAKELSFNNA